MVVRVWGLCVLALAVGCGPGLSVEEQAARYFALVDGVTFTYESASGLTEEHQYEAGSTGDDGALSFSRVARRGGFVQDDQTLTLRVVDADVYIAQFYDCLTRCGRPDNDVKLLTFPLEAGQVNETDVTVDVSTNGVDEGSRAERHRFAVGDERDISVPAGEFTGFDVLWSRTIDGDTDSASFVVVEDVGWVEVQSFDGAVFSLTTVPDLGTDEES